MRADGVGVSAALVFALIAAAAAVGTGCGGVSGGRAGLAAARSPGQRGAPSWVPPYTPAQLALLEPPDVPIQVPATRVFPDLTRFAYASEHRMEEPEEGLRFTRMVVSILTDSPRYYVLKEAGPELANKVAQYGPAGPAEPDPWQTVRRGAGGVGQLVQAPIDGAAREAYAQGEARLGASDVAGARAAFEEAAEKSPEHPAVRLGLARALSQGGDLAGAQAAYERALKADPTLASAHTGLAELHERRGDVGAARRHLAEALAYHPSSKRAWDAAGRITPGGAGLGRVEPYAIFLDVDSVGAVHVGSPPSGAAQVYAGCRAILRYEPEVRAAIFSQPPETPYFLSVVEEVVCMEASIGAYLVEQAEAAGLLDPTTPREGPPPEGDARLEALAKLAHEEGLGGYVMFEILGMHRPERARGAPPDLHRAVVRYVERHVLAQRGRDGDGAPDGLYTAAR
jgi:tetratricopeptide (TPR) repeat protein